jgi:hypothetical protein
MFFCHVKFSLGWPARKDVIFDIHVELVQNPTTTHKSKNHTNVVKFHVTDFTSHMCFLVNFPWACAICIFFCNWGHTNMQHDRGGLAAGLLNAHFTHIRLLAYSSVETVAAAMSGTYTNVMMVKTKFIAAFFPLIASRWRRLYATPISLILSSCPSLLLK